MISMQKKMRHYWSSWVRKRALSVNPQRLDSGNLYIFPSLFGWAFGVVLFTLFLCAINYQVSSVFFLTFLLAVAGMVSALEAHYNLKGLSAKCLSIEDAYQGDSIKVVLLLIPERRRCYAVEYGFHDQDAIKLDILKDESVQIVLNYPAKNRGCFQLPMITLFSYFPLGLFRVWGYIYFDANERINGEASYNFWKLFTLALNSFISLSLLPLKLAGNLGVVITLFSGIAGFYILLGKYFFHWHFASTFSDAENLAILIVFLVGILLNYIGLIALYIANIHGEVINRPMYVVRKKRD